MTNGHPTERRPQGSHRASRASRAGHSGAVGTAPAGLVQFAQNYGWWRVVAIPVMTVLTAWVLIDVARGADDAPADVQAASESASSAAASQPDGASAGASAGASSGGKEDEPGKVGPDPAQSRGALSIDELPAGGPFTEEGKKTFHQVGQPGLKVGKGERTTIRYSVEIEDGVDASHYGGEDAFAAAVDATLSDPRGWTADPGFAFEHVAADANPDTRIQLASLRTTAELCGAQLETETSCHTTVTGVSTVILNEARWVRGAAPYEGDLGNYRQYLLNHEFGHAIGYAAHQPCGESGALAPIMMQQTLSLKNSDLYAKDPNEAYPDNDKKCEPNPWPYPRPEQLDVENPQAR